MAKKILIADDHYVVRVGTAIILEDSQYIVDHVENYMQLLEMIKKTPFDMVILDIEMPGTKFELMIGEIKELIPHTKILVFTAHKENLALNYINYGADGYLHKACSEKRILEAIETIFNHGYFYPQELLHNFVNNTSKRSRVPQDRLSERELQVYNFLIEGYGILEISNTLNIHMSTVSTHKKRIFEKLEVNSIAKLIQIHNKYY